MKIEDEKEDNDVDEEEQATPAPSEPHSPTKPHANDHTEAANGEGAAGDGPFRGSLEKSALEENNGTQRRKSQSKRNSLVTQPAAPDRTETSSREEDAGFDAMSKEREALREEVAQMRKTLEEIQERHEEEMSGIREQLSQTEEGKEQAEIQYQNLLGKVNTIRSQLGERLKADAVRKAFSKACI